MATEAKALPAQPRAAVLVHPKKVDVATFRAEVEAAERRNGWAPSVWFETRRKRPVDRDELLRTQPDLVLVAGGDGTVRRTIALVLGTGLPLGIVPSGTGNLLARELGLPISSVEAALDVAMGGSERTLDVLQVTVERDDGSSESHVSVVLSGVGIDAAMIANTQPGLKKRFGWVAYVDGVRRSLADLSAFPARVTIDGEPARTHRAMAVFVANLANLPGGLSLAPGASVDDGRLDLIVLQPRRLADWLLIWRRVTWENGFLRRSELGSQIAEAFKGRNRSQVVTRRGRGVTIELLGDPQPFQIDGDWVGYTSRVSVAVNPHGIQTKSVRPSTAANRAD